MQTSAQIPSKLSTSFRFYTSSWEESFLLDVFHLCDETLEVDDVYGKTCSMNTFSTHIIFLYSGERRGWDICKTISFFHFKALKAHLIETAESLWITFIERAWLLFQQKNTKITKFVRFVHTFLRVIRDEWCSSGKLRPDWDHRKFNSRRAWILTKSCKTLCCSLAYCTKRPEKKLKREK